jgi:hypothetical protein
MVYAVRWAYLNYRAQVVRRSLNRKKEQARKKKKTKNVWGVSFFFFFCSSHLLGGVAPTL